MRIIDADKFLTYLIFSKHIDGLTCGEVKEVIEMCKVDILDKIRAEIKQYQSDYDVHGTEYDRTAWTAFNRCLQIIDKYKAESEKTDG